MRAQDAAVSYTAFRLIDETGNRLGRLVPVPARLSYRQLLKNTAIATLTGMVDTAKTGPIRMTEARRDDYRSEEHTSELQSLMRISYAVFCLKKKKQQNTRLTPRSVNTQ